MLWHKAKYSIDVVNGDGNVLIKPVYGLLQQLTIVPEKKFTWWGIVIRDEDKDIIYERRCFGRLDERIGIPVGLAAPERLNISIMEANRFFMNTNQKFDVLLKVREK